MAKTYLDQLVEYPAKIISRIASDDTCVALMVNKAVSEITEQDYDEALEKNIFDYQYVDGTTQEAGVYIWVDVEICRVDNMQIKDVRGYITIACHKSLMKLDKKKYAGFIGNRKDNLVRYVDKLLNNKEIMGIGKLKLEYVKTMASISGYTIKELAYIIPDFNIVPLGNK